MRTAWVVRIHTVGWKVVVGTEIGSVSSQSSCSSWQRFSCPPPNSEYTSESNIPYSGCFVKWFVNTPRFLFDSRCFWISTLQQVCHHWLVSTTCRAGCSSSCEGIAGTSNASGQNTKWRNQQDPIPKRQHTQALVVCHNTRCNPKPFRR